MRVVIEFDSEWLLSRRDDPTDPFDKISQLVRDNFLCKNIVQTGVSTLTVNIIDESVGDEAKLKEEISKLIGSEYDFENGAGYSIEISASDENEEEKSSVSAPSTESASERRSEVMDAINALTGAEEFKSLAAEICKAADGLIQNKLEDAFAERAYIISVDNGYGLSRYLELFADLVDALGLVNLSRGRAFDEIKVNVPTERDETLNFEINLCKTLDSIPGRHIICFDISDWVGRMSDPNFQRLLGCVERRNDKHIFFFRVPFVERDILSDIEYAVNDMLSVKALSITPFDNAQLRSFAEKMISEKGFTLEDDAWDMFDLRIAEEKNDGKFYGIKTVRKVVNDLLYLKIVSDSECDGAGKTISAADIKPLVEGLTRDERTGLEQLNDLVGADGLRKQIMEIVSQIEYSRSNSVKPPCIHMRFVGNPGTGKTTVARILGKILKEKGILRKGNFFEVFSRDLCGQYIGSTAPRTTAKCRDAYGSVLFIDEAYALYNSDSRRDFGREAIDTLIAQMENHRSDLVVIMAGYPDKMETLMEANQGLRSRMPYTIKFPNYSRSELSGIFMKMAEGAEYDEAFKTAVETFFNELSDDVLDSPEFSNARYVRNLYERTWGKAVLRSRMEGGDPNRLTAEDFAAASADDEFVKTPERKKRRLGFY